MSILVYSHNIPETSHLTSQNQSKNIYKTELYDLISNLDPNRWTSSPWKCKLSVYQIVSPNVVIKNERKESAPSYMVAVSLQGVDDYVFLQTLNEIKKPQDQKLQPFGDSVCTSEEFIRFLEKGGHTKALKEVIFTGTSHKNSDFIINQGLVKVSSKGDPTFKGKMIHFSLNVGHYLTDTNVINDILLEFLYKEMNWIKGNMNKSETEPSSGEVDTFSPINIKKESIDEMQLRSIIVSAHFKLGFLNSTNTSESEVPRSHSSIEKLERLKPTAQNYIKMCIATDLFV